MKTTTNQPFIDVGKYTIGNHGSVMGMWKGSEKHVANQYLQLPSHILETRGRSKNTCISVESRISDTVDASDNF